MTGWLVRTQTMSSKADWEMTCCAAAQVTSTQGRIRKQNLANGVEEDALKRRVEHPVRFQIPHAPPTEPSAEISPCILRVSRSRFSPPLWLDRG